MNIDFDEYMRKHIKPILIFIVCMFLMLIGVSLLAKSCFEDDPKLKPIQIEKPIEEIKKIDSIKQETKVIKENIIKLDSIKDDTIKKVKKLNNDSTLELFRKLVWE